jgi:hypothetical protein
MEVELASKSTGRGAKTQAGTNRHNHAGGAMRMT